MRNTVAMLACVLALLVVAGCAEPGTNHASPKELSRIAGWKGSDVNSADAFRFVVMSDRTGGHEPGAWAKAVTEVNRLKPDFVMCVGDLIEGYGDDKAELERQWQEFDRLTAKLEAPFFYCPGNHDITGAAPREVYTRRRARGGRTYYSFNYRKCHFVVLDSDAIVNDTKGVVDEQWAWLEKDLAAARGASHVFVFEHHPLYAGPHWKRLAKLLDPKRTTVFAGHFHRLSYDLEDGVPYIVLGHTATGGGSDDRSKGTFKMFAHVTVAAGRPRVAIIAVGNVLPHDLISRALGKRVATLGRGVSLSPTTRAGGQVTLELANPTDAQASYTLSWSGAAAWFVGGPPKVARLTLAAGDSARRTYRIPATPASLAPPTLEVSYALTHRGQQGQGKRSLRLPVVATLTAARAGKMTIDGKLNDWPAAGTSTNARWQVRDNPDQWSGPKDCAMLTRIAYDGENVYVAIDVRDEKIVTEGRQTWLRDGVEVFWDPRPAGARGGRFVNPCRQLMIPVPAAGEAPQPKAGPIQAVGQIKAKVACLRRAGGYTVELAVPAASIAEGFKPAPGATLRMEFFANDKDETAGQTTGMVLSGDSDASRNTAGYAIVTFK